MLKKFSQIKGVQLNCQVNKDLTRRVKPVPPVTWARGVVIHDIQQLQKIVEVFDKKGKLWQYQEKEEDHKEGTEGDEAGGGEGKNEEETMETSNEEKELQVKVCSIRHFFFIVQLCAFYWHLFKTNY